MRVLLVEDDAMIGRSLQAGLGAQGLAVDWVTSGLEAEEALTAQSYSVMLLDLGLPDMTGLDILKNLRRAKNNTAVLILTARDDVSSRISGLDLGADDYLTKPFDFDELMARIRAVVRRHSGHAASLLISGEVTLDLANHTVAYRGKSVILPAREFALMVGLVERPGSILSRAQLEDRLYGFGEEVESNAVDVLIFYIRKKFDAEIIRNIRGVGWTIPKVSR